MTVKTIGAVLSAQDLKRIADERETAKLQELLEKRHHEEEEEHLAQMDFMARDVGPEEIERFNQWVRRAAERGKTEVKILRFPARYCADHGRAINNLEEGWPATLTGYAKRVHVTYLVYLQPQGYRIRAQILTYSDVGLGDVGLYVGW
jgi:hypothetical protein